MGEIAGWQCDDCGASEEFFCGGGMFSFNEPRVVEGAKEGAYGPAMRALLGDGVPSGWTVSSERCFFACGGCGSIIEGESFTIDDRSGGWLVYHASPGVCGKCGHFPDFWDERVPLTDREIAVRCDRRAEEGCPECGSKNVLLQMGCWD